MELSENFCTRREHKGYRSQVCKSEFGRLADCPYGLRAVRLSEDNKSYLRGCENFEINQALRSQLFEYLFKRKEKKRVQRTKYQQRRMEKRRRLAHE